MPRANRHFLPGYIWHITHRVAKKFVQNVPVVQPLRSVQDIVQSNTDESERKTIDVEAIAVGSLAFVERVKNDLGVKAMHREVLETDGNRQPRSKSCRTKATWANSRACSAAAFSLWVQFSEQLPNLETEEGSKPVFALLYQPKVFAYATGASPLVYCALGVLTKRQVPQTESNPFGCAESAKHPVINH